ncbi:uncharacterized protein [Triticum aestivum]|uniref:uncharacterized protein n=1 Tax=Triticum aestivum TaxID=4565 RepID=UPI001D00BB1E|nr:uncharacterized protein LOC123044929 [Triticum aestivum]
MSCRLPPPLNSSAVAPPAASTPLPQAPCSLRSSIPRPRRTSRVAAPHWTSAPPGAAMGTVFLKQQPPFGLGPVRSCNPTSRSPFPAFPSPVIAASDGSWPEAALSRVSLLCIERRCLRPVPLTSYSLLFVVCIAAHDSGSTFGSSFVEGHSPTSFLRFGSCQVRLRPERLHDDPEEHGFVKFSLT